MKILLKCCLVISLVTPVISTYAYPLSARLEKMTKVIEKDGRSIFCVASARSDNQKNKPIFLPTIAVCVGDVSLNSGTVREKNGCCAYVLNTNNLSTLPLLQGFGYNIVENRKCSDGGFEAVMADLFYTDYTGNRNQTFHVDSAFLSPYGLPSSIFDVHVVFAQKTTMETLLNKESKWNAWFKTESAKRLSRKK